MVNDDPLPPWFSGLGLVSECASHYELEQSQDGDSGSAAGESPGRQASEEKSVLGLEGLAPITIFVSANNSGKSRLMREIFLQEKFSRFKLSVTQEDGTTCGVNPIIEEAVSFARGETELNLYGGGWLFDAANRQGCLDVTLVNQTLNNFDDYHRPGYPGNDHDRKKAKLTDLGFTSGIRKVKEIQRWYVPILRGMRPPLTPVSESSASTRNCEDLYAMRTVHDYFSQHPSPPVGWDGNQICRVFTGLSVFADLRSRLLGRTQSERDSVRHYEDFLSGNFFGGMKVILVPVEEDGNDVVHIKIGNKEEYPIYQLGDGLQSLIICTYPIVTEQKPGSLFFIEEPDLGMHPSLQRSFVDVLKSYHLKKGHQFFLTTHSNHLLDLLEDDELVSIFSFSEKQIGSPERLRDPAPSTSPAKFRIRQALSRDRQVLMQLGVRPSATYLANATIWVEGPSDCAYLRAYMEAFIDYLKAHGNDFGEVLAQRLSAYKEDRHYAFVEYSGANLIHFDFAEVNENASNDSKLDARDTTTHVPSLCAQSIVIADGDIADKGNRLEKMTANLGERFILLPGKEIENLITEATVRLLVKTDNRIKHLAEKDLDETLGAIIYAGYARKAEGDTEKLLGLGKYLDQIIEENSENSPFRRFSKDKSGTLESHAKGRWAKQLSRLIRQQRRDHEAAHNSEIVELPPWLNQDLVWLMVLIYEHISLVNYDTAALQSLRDWKQWIRRYDDHQVVSDQWPIPNPAEDPDGARKCLLTAFLKSQG